jgi:hypothetical protein
MRRTLAVWGFVGVIILGSCAVRAQDLPAQLPTASSTLPSDYPMDRAGVFIRNGSWKLLANQNPIKTKTAHGVAAALSYGLVPAKVVAEYVGEHAPTGTSSGQISICICHIVSLPGEPVIVRLHEKKDARELNGGKMIVLPLVGGSKMADASKSDLIPSDVSQPDPQVWIIRSQSPLPPGEYALMLGTQNLSIFAFSISSAPSVSGETMPKP